MDVAYWHVALSAIRSSGYGRVSTTRTKAEAKHPEFMGARARAFLDALTDPSVMAGQRDPSLTDR
jgi:hypothetical protein